MQTSYARFVSALRKPPLLGSTLAVLLLAVSARAQQTAASLSGTVTDKQGAFVSNALITVRLDSTQKQTITDTNGHFTIPDVPAGQYSITIAADGMQSLTTKGEIHAATAEQLPHIALAVATATADAEVTVSQQDLAQAEVKVEEKQRLLGAIPNFYVTYDWHAAPLNTRQKYELGWRTTIDPITVVINAGIAGAQQAMNDFSGYGQGASGYFKRFGAANADTAVATMLGGSVLPALFHQDPRYFYMGRGTVMHRTLYALSTAVVARGDNGKWQPAYASILGDFGAGAVSNLYYPAANRQGAGLTIEAGLIGILSDGLGNVIQEFVLRRFTKNPPPTYNPIKP